MSKRKATSPPGRDDRVSDELHDKSTTSIVDPDGDLYMNLDEGRLLVSRKALCLSSSVFQAMLGEGSRFGESEAKVFASDDIQQISFKEDNFATMQIVAWIIHLRNDKVPLTVSFAQLYELAVVCDKYDLRRCFGQWPPLWSKPYFSQLKKEGFESWLFISIVFGDQEAFAEITRHLILNSKLSETGTLLTANGYDFSGGVPESVLSPLISNPIEKYRF